MLKVIEILSKIYANIQKERISAFKEFKKDVISNKFPQKKHIIGIKKDELETHSKFFLIKKRFMII